MNINQAIKSEMSEYFAATGVVDSVISKVITRIGEAYMDGTSIIDQDIYDENKSYCDALGLKIGQEIYLRLTWNFSPARYPDILKFIEKIDEDMQIAITEEIALEDAINDAIAEELGSDRDDEAHFDYIVEIYKNCIEVVANVSGVGDRIPKAGRNYIGNQSDVRWRYPLSALPSLKNAPCIIDIEKLKKNA